jgi:hypothetical protein
MMWLGNAEIVRCVNVLCATADFGVVHARLPRRRKRGFARRRLARLIPLAGQDLS